MNALPNAPSGKETHCLQNSLCPLSGSKSLSLSERDKALLKKRNSSSRDTSEQDSHMYSLGLLKTYFARCMRFTSFDLCVSNKISATEKAGEHQQWFDRLESGLLNKTQRPRTVLWYSTACHWVCSAGKPLFQSKNSSKCILEAAHCFWSICFGSSNKTKLHLLGHSLIIAPVLHSVFHHSFF